MTYREALHIGSAAEGIIKCTYARLYNKDGKNLFSLQRKSAEKKVVYGGDLDGDGVPDTISYDGEKKHDAVEFDQYFQDEDKGKIYFDLPMVKADEISNNRLVPAYFTPEAVEIIRAAMQKMRIAKWTVWRVWDVNTPGAAKGNRRAMQHTYTWSQDWERSWMLKDTDNYHHEFSKEQVLNPRFERLIEIITSGEAIYIKPAAFEWYATDIKNATTITTDENGNEIEINLNEAVENARKKMEQAKAVLIGAGLTNIL